MNARLATDAPGEPLDVDELAKALRERGYRCPLCGEPHWPTDGTHGYEAWRAWEVARDEQKRREEAR